MSACMPNEEFDETKVTYEAPRANSTRADIVSDKFITWSSVPQNLKTDMKAYVKKWILSQEDPYSLTTTELYIDGYKYVVKRKLFGPNIAVLVKYAILEVMTDLKLNLRPFTISTDGRGWYIHFVMLLPVQQNISATTHRDDIP